MSKSVRRAFVAMLLALTAGCSLFESEPEALPVSQPGPVEPTQVQVTAVRTIEIGRTRNGVIITATGTAPGLGFGEPRLVARRDGQINREGFLEYDFVATPPDSNLNLPKGTLAARAIRADLPVTLKSLRNVRGIRVFSEQNGVQFIFSEG